MLIGIVLAIIIAVLAFMVAEGLWSNAVMFFNVVTAALLAMNYFELLATYLDSQMGAYTYFWDFLSLWGIFGVSLIVLRAVTDRVSRVRMKFRKPVEIAGGIFFALWTAWVMVSFTLTTLHTAPLQEHFMGFQQTPDEYMIGGLAPDRRWLAFVQKVSLGALGHGQPFDPKADFVLKYGDRRATLENTEGTSFLVAPTK